MIDGQELHELSDSIRGDALRRGADEHTAEDVVQETWLRALRRPPRDPAGFRGWLHVVARRCLRELRATNLIGGYVRDIVQDARLEPVSAIDPRIRVWFNPQLVSRHFMVPGVLALVLLVVTANLAAMAIVREKEVGTLEQLNVTPLRRWELIIGKLLPYGLIGMIDVFLVVAVAVYWFEVPLRGSLALLIALSGLYVLCTLALGLFVSTTSDTQQQAMMTSIFFFIMPMIYLSGFIFPIENMPQVIQWFTYLIPLRYFLIIVRGIFLKGIGLEILWPQVAALAMWGTVVLALAVARSRKRMA